MQTIQLLVVGSEISCSQWNTFAKGIELEFAPLGSSQRVSHLFGVKDLLEVIPCDKETTAKILSLAAQEDITYSEYVAVLAEIYTFVRRYVHGKSAKLFLEKHSGLFSGKSLPFLITKIDSKIEDRNSPSSALVIFTLTPLKKGLGHSNGTFDVPLRLSDLSNLLLLEPKMKSLINYLASPESVSYSSWEPSWKKIVAYIQEYCHNQQINLSPVS